MTELAGATRIDPRSEELEGQRSAAARGLVVERVVLLADSSRRGDADVRELVELDATAGVKTTLVDAANALPPIDVGPRFALLDDESVASPAGSEWVESRDPEDLRRARAAARALTAAVGPARDPSPDTAELVVDEPLVRSAPIARALAPALCRPVGPGADDCAPYHGLVQYLRLLGMVASPQRLGQFYRSTLGSLASSGRRRVLIAGAADYSMLAHTLAAYEQAGAAPDVTVIDRCPTPLVLCRWYAGTCPLAIATETANILDFEAEPFDVICSDALLMFLTAEEKSRALRRTAALLRPGGRVVTVLRIAPEAGEGPQSFGDDHARAFGERARAEMSRRAGLLPLDPDVIAREARRYSRGLAVYPTRSCGELCSLFADAGLKVEALNAREVAGAATVAAPGAPQTATYAEIVAVRG